MTKHGILLIIIVSVTTVFAWVYMQRLKLDYNSEGRFYSLQDGVVYNEQAIAVYGFFTFLGLVLTGILIIKITKKK